MIFQYLSYKEFLNDYFSSLAGGGRGQSKKLAEFLGVSTVVVSQTLKGDRDFSIENAFKTTKYLKLSTLERKYFLKLVDYQKAGNYELKEFYLSELKDLQKKSREIKSKYSGVTELSDDDKAIFYSDRFYSSIRMASSLPTLNKVEDFAKYFNITQKRAQDIISFLVRTKLCKQDENGLSLGVQSTFVPANSIYIKNHHRNWRLHSMNRIDQLGKDELMYTAPFSMSLKDYETLRVNLLKVIEDTIKLIGPSKEETIACLNIDLLKI